MGCVHDASGVAGARVCLIGEKRHLLAALEFAWENTQRDPVGLSSR